MDTNNTLVIETHGLSKAYEAVWRFQKEEF
jgi:hypothetical protein